MIVPLKSVILDPDKAWRFLGPDLGSYCLQKIISGQRGFFFSFYYSFILAYLFIHFSTFIQMCTEAKTIECRIVLGYFLTHSYKQVFWVIK